MNISCTATYFLKTAARFSLKVTTKASFRFKKVWKLRFFRLLFKSKNGEVRSKNGVTVINLAWLYLLQQHIFRNLVHTFHWKWPPKLLLEVKKLWKSRFLGYFSKAKTEECNQKTWSVCNTFDITIRRSAKCYAEVSAHVPQKIATKSSFRGKNTQKKLIFKVLF